MNNDCHCPNLPTTMRVCEKKRGGGGRWEAVCANEIKKRGVCFENCFIEIFSNKKLFKFLQIVFRLMEIFFFKFYTFTKFHIT